MSRPPIADEEIRRGKCFAMAAAHAIIE